MSVPMITDTVASDAMRDVGNGGGADDIDIATTTMDVFVEDTYNSHLVKVQLSRTGVTTALALREFIMAAVIRDFFYRKNLERQRQGKRYKQIDEPRFDIMWLVNPRTSTLIETDQDVSQLRAKDLVLVYHRDRHPGTTSPWHSDSPSTKAARQLYYAMLIVATRINVLAFDFHLHAAETDREAMQFRFTVTDYVTLCAFADGWFGVDHVANDCAGVWCKDITITDHQMRIDRYIPAGGTFVSTHTPSLRGTDRDVISLKAADQWLEVFAIGNPATVFHHVRRKGGKFAHVVVHHSKPPSSVTTNITCSQSLVRDIPRTSAHKACTAHGFHCKPLLPFNSLV